VLVGATALGEEGVLSIQETRLATAHRHGASRKKIRTQIFVVLGGRVVAVP
jgi:hypothetical protein